MENPTRKEVLLERLSGLEDEEVLSIIESVLDSHTKSDYLGWKDLPTSVQESIDLGIQQLEKGEGIPHSVVMEELGKKYSQDCES